MSSSDRRSSLHDSLTRTLVAGAGLILLGAGFAIHWTVTDRLTDLYDRGLEAKASSLVALTTEDAVDGVEFDYTEALVPGYGEDDDEPDYFQLWIDGDELSRSSSLGGGELPREPWVAGTTRIRDLRLRDGRPGRLVQVDFRPQVDVDEDDDEKEGDDEVAVRDDDENDGGDDSGDGDEDEEGDVDDEDDPDGFEGGARSTHRATLVAATSREPLDESIATLALGLGGTGVVLMILVVGLVRTGVGKALRPLREVGRQVEDLDADHLSFRIDPAGVPAEIEPLVVRLNELLERLETAFARERRFSADVAHELRTPVAELKNAAEVASRWPEDRRASVAFFEDVLDIAIQMEGIVTNLLALARVDAGQEVVELDEVRIEELLESVWRRLQREAKRRSVDLDTDFPENLVVRTDRSKLELVLVNLLGNAIAHSPPGASVMVGTRESAGTVDLFVENPAPNLDREDLDHLFDRFWRKDDARSVARHAGLGLPLVQAFASLLGVEVKASLHSAGLRIALRRFEVSPAG